MYVQLVEHARTFEWDCRGMCIYMELQGRYWLQDRQTFALQHATHTFGKQRCSVLEHADMQALPSREKVATRKHTFCVWNHILHPFTVMRKFNLLYCYPPTSLLCSSMHTLMNPLILRQLWRRRCEMHWPMVSALPMYAKIKIQVVSVLPMHESLINNLQYVCSGDN